MLAFSQFTEGQGAAADVRQHRGRGAGVGVPAAREVLPDPGVAVEPEDVLEVAGRGPGQHQALGADQFLAHALLAHAFLAHAFPAHVALTAVRRDRSSRSGRW